MLITVAKQEIDTSRFPGVTTDALLKRAVNHFVGNEPAAKAVYWANSEAAAKFKAANPEFTGTPTESDLAHYLPTDEEKATQKEIFQAEAVQRLYDGKISAGERGPRKDPVEQAVLDIGRKEITSILLANGHKFTKASPTAPFKQADGTVVQLDQEGWAIRWLHGRDKAGKFGEPGSENLPRIHALAVAEVEARAEKAAERAAKAKQMAGVELSADELGI